MPMIPGTSVTLGKNRYLIPPLNFNAMELHKEFLTACMNGEMDPANAMKTDFLKMAEIIHLALRRNYPDLTLEALKDDLDISNLTTAFEAVMKTTGFEPALAEKRPGEA